MIGKISGIITFYYNKDSIFNDVSLLSAYMTKNLATEASSAMDEFVITEDEREIFNECVKQSVPSIYETIVKLTSGIDDAFNDNAVIEGDDESGLEREEGKYVEFKVLDNDAYNANILRLVDDTLRDCLKYGILSEFYSICVNGSLYRIAQDKFTANLFQLKQRLFQLKKKVVSTSLS